MTDLHRFVADLMAAEGAIVEPVGGDCLDVMAPELLREALGWPELARLVFGAQRPAGAIAIGLESDWLQRFEVLLGARGQLAERQLALPDWRPPGDPHALLDRAIILPNAIWRLVDAAPTWTRLLLLGFRYSAVSNERRDGLLHIGLNTATGAVLNETMLARYRLCLDADNAETWANAETWQAPEPQIAGAAGPPGDPAALEATVRALLEVLAPRDLAPFLRAMRRRLQRDADRLYAYHDDLHRAARDKLHAFEQAAAQMRAGAQKAAATIARERQRLTAIERDYAAKLDDLRHNYALQVSVDLIQALTLLVPVERYNLLIRRRKGERSIAMDWHPVTRSFEPPLSEDGPAQHRRRHVCDEHLHLTATAVGLECPVCAKPWCRACHPHSCPRCKGARPG